MPRYKYESAQEWLSIWTSELAQEGNITQLKHIIEQLAMETDADTIQDLFQDAMEADHYFNDLDQIACDDCGERFDADQITELAFDGEVQQLCPECYQAMTS